MKLYALLIAINDYPVRGHQLNGCIRDLNAVDAFFKKYCEANQIGYVPSYLKDAAATREGVIQGFQHFDQVQDGDICFLYFSGHGSQMPSPPEFWKIDVNRKCETIVCFDSRLKDGRDLADKEISYLIYKHTQQAPKAHFFALFDSCHSGSISRDIDVVHRMAETNTREVLFDDFLGSEIYKKQDELPVKSHLVFSAARSYQSAVELTIEGEKRGLFTYALLQAMEKSNLANTSYQELRNKTQTFVNGKYSLQNPVLEALGTANVDNLFLNGSLQSNPQFTLNYMPNDGRWMLYKGSIHGLVEGTSIVVLDENQEEKTLKIDEVEPGHAYVEKGDWMQEASNYQIKSIDIQQAKLKVAFHTDCPIDKVNALQSKINPSKDSFEIIEDISNPSYLINHSRERGYIFIKPSENRPVFKAIAADETGAITRFLNNIDKVAHWENTSQLSNPSTTLDLNELVEVQFLEVTEHRNHKKVLATVEQAQDGTAFFSYTIAGDKEISPTFSLSIKNISDNQAIWVGALFLDEQYGISDAFLKMKELQPNSEAYRATFYSPKNNYYYDIIPLRLPDEILAWGETEIQNQFKIIVSTQELSIASFNQEELELEQRPATRSIPMGRKVIFDDFDDEADWATKDISFTIHRPQAGQALQANQDLTLASQLTIEANPGLSASSVRLASSHSSTRSVDGFIPPHQLGLENFAPLNLSIQKNVDFPLDTLEMEDVHGAENINAGNPLKINFDSEDIIIPFGYDAATGLYYPLGYTDKDGVTHIEDLPSATETITKGLGKSIKIYLQRVWYKNIVKKEDPYPILAQAIVDEDENLTYEKDLQKIKTILHKKNTKHVILFVHGIIGDTSDKPKLLRRAKQETRSLHDVYDLALTFDYDSLGVQIEQSAKDLKRKLEKELGLKTGHGKSIHIVAHSMGGLISRWYLEKLGGNEIVSHFIQVGTPNLGSPWASAYDMFTWGLGYAINFTPKPAVIKQILSFLGKQQDKLEINAKNMQADSGFYKELNDDKAGPTIPYTIVTGKTALIPRAGTRQYLFSKNFLKRFKGTTYTAIDTVFFKEGSDAIVSLPSIQGVPGEEDLITITEPVGCDHFTYFNTDAGIERLAEVLFGVLEKEA